MFDTKLTFAPSLFWQARIRRHYEKIIAGSFGCIDHFAVNLILPDKTTMTLCPNSDYLIHYNQQQISKIEIALSPWKLRNFPVVPWRLELGENDSKRFNQLIHFKEDLHHLRAGMTFVAKLDDCYLTVGVATHKKTPDCAIKLIQNMHEILNMGAYLYDLLKPDLQTLQERIIPESREIILTDSQYLIAEEFSKSWHDRRQFTLQIPNELD